MSGPKDSRSEEHTSELQSLRHLVCRLLLEKKKTKDKREEEQCLRRKRCRQDVRSVCRVARLSEPLLCRHSVCILFCSCFFFFFFFNDTAPPEIYTLPLHDALPI